MSPRGSKWSVTCNLLNIKRETVEHCISAARQQGWTVLGQIEKGENGTEHYQLAVATPQVRFGAIKKIFPTAHIEPAKNWTALLKYVHKDETRIEKIIENKFVTFQMVRDKFFDHLVEEYDINVHRDEEKIEMWDDFIQHSIRENIECDLVGVNPQYRSCIMRYWDAYCYLALHRQTDRQTQETFIPTIDIPNANTEEEISEEETSDEETDGSQSPF